MSKAPTKFKNVSLKNRTALGIIIRNIDSENSDSENSENESDNLNKTLTPNREQIISSFDNLYLGNEQLSNMDNIRFHTSLLPTFSGKQEHLESFILSIDEFYSLYFNNSDEQRRLVTAAIKSKLVEDARNFYLSRPDLASWPEIKLGLR
ncbi:hypothetical protein ABEB36_009450 [Hypothenemus hampei]|uniref:Uncharacterized protein n=1 Tax=Hypothenemus hampei TaxID=57062 RepID=A0ABD1EGV9_HYPHA